MTDAFSRKSPVPLAGGKDRANIVHKQAPSIIATQEPEADFAATWIAARYRLPLPLARTIATMASIGGRFA
jgi:hypothetical protein